MVMWIESEGIENNAARKNKSTKANRIEKTLSKNRGIPRTIISLERKFPLDFVDIWSPFFKKSPALFDFVTKGKIHFGHNKFFII